MSLIDQIFNTPNQRLNDSSIPQKKESLQSLWRLLNILMANLNFEDVVYKIVNSILIELGYLKSGYRIVVLSLIDEQKGGLRRIALSQTPEAARALAASTVPFEKIVIPFNASDNLGIKVLYEKEPLVTTSWPDILTPPLTPEAALNNQKAAGIKTSMVYPVFAQGKPIGTLIFSMVKNYKDVTQEEKDLLGGFSDLVGLAVQNSLLYTSLSETRDNLIKTNLEIQRMNNQLHQLDQLKDDFVSIVSHELRTPMTAIRSYVWMALNRADVELSEKMKKYLVRTLISTERLINLVNNLLNISRIESGRIEIIPQAFNMKELVSEVFSEIEPKAKEREVNLVVLDSKIPEVFADPDKIHQVLLNLVSNAVKFTPAGGSVSVEFFTDGKVVETKVKDTGVGISKEDLQRLFQKFGRLDNSYVAAATVGGTGLGLYISKMLIELSKGKIWAESLGMNKGATFIYSLPIVSKQVIEESNKYTTKARGEIKVLEPIAIF